MAESAARRLIRLLTRALVPGAALLLLGASLYFAGDAAGDGQLARYYPWLLSLSALALLVLAAAIVQRVWRLLQQLRRGAPGARLTGRLTLMLALIAAPPVVVVYGFALNFLNVTIDTWFNVRLEQALDDALGIGRQYVDERLRRARNGSETLARSLEGLPDSERQFELDQALDDLGATELALFSADRVVLASASADPRFLAPAYPDTAILVRLRGGGGYAAAEPMGNELMLRTVTPIDPGPLSSGVLLQGLFAVPAEFQPLAQRVEGAYHDFQRLKYLRGSLKLTFTLILSFVLLLSVLLAVLAAFGLARRLVRPIGQLAAATRAVAAGRFEGELPVPADDELGFLVRSFNQMTRELEMASARERRAAEEGENQRAYLLTVLERLSSGVFGVDAEGVLRTVNHAAEAILAAPVARYIGQHLSALRHDYPELAPLIEPLLRHGREALREWREEIRIERAGDRQILVLRGAELAPGAGATGGYVAVFDDLTVLNRAQRDAAWAEVARRLAHEVKNPLTPIQLAAERLRRRFLGRLPPEEAELMDRATHTIVSQVEALKALVNAFGDYARPPQLNAQPLALHALLVEVLDLYENDQRIKLTRRFAAEDLQLRADAGRLRQALHNLLKNALEAIGDATRPVIEVRTQRVEDAGRAWVELEVADNGPGLPGGFDARWYEPYTTSKVKGTGLGLAVVKKIAEEHGGSVRAENRPEGGACFTLRLPLA